MIQLKPYSTTFLSLGGFLLMAMGIYFLFLRPPLLPEDARYIGLNLTTIQSLIPALSAWLQKVFWVMGGYIFTTGLLTLYVAQTSFRTRSKGAFEIIIISGISSIGSMAFINFVIQSDFKWILLAFTLPWFVSLILFRLHR